MSTSIRVALAGNPNSGKTTLFNALTGARHKVGNWSGVTVEKKEGLIKHNGESIAIVDLPGTYSLSPYSIEEKIARNYIVEESPDVVVNIVDASNLERNLYLSLQLMELGKPVVMALNMMDVANSLGYEINVDKLSKTLGIPIIPMSAAKKQGLKELIDAISQVSKNPKLSSPIQVDYGEALESKILDTMNNLTSQESLSKYNPRWLALKILEEDPEIMESTGIAPVIDSSLMLEEEVELMVADKRYSFIASLIGNSMKKPTSSVLSISDKIDLILTNKYLGLPIFALLMFGVFYFTFDLVGNQLNGMIDEFINGAVAPAVSAGLENAKVSPWLQSLIVDGIIGGVGGVLTFLPNIACLFLAISIMEDSGYMARVAFIMDRAMKKVGLSGKAFIPMILGFGCNVPAIMGTRTLENENDRLTSILVNPFMSCSARLPVYILFAGAFFPGNEKFVVYSLYILGIFVAILMALIFKTFLFKSEVVPFIMELPPYRLPSFTTTLANVWERVKGFLIKAGTLIFGVSVVLWFILGYNFSGPAEITESIGASLGNVFAPIFAPLGFGTWQAALSLLTGILAKEVVVSNMSIIYGLTDGASAQSFFTALNGSFTQLTAYAFMVFVLLYTPCAAAIGAVKRETNSWKWTTFSVVYQFAVAWFFAFLVFQIGKLLGF